MPPKARRSGFGSEIPTSSSARAISTVSIEGGKAAWTGRVVLFQKFFVILNVMGPKVNHKGDAFSSKPQEIPGRLICGFYVVKMYVDKPSARFRGPVMTIGISANFGTERRGSVFVTGARIIPAVQDCKLPEGKGALFLGQSKRA